MKICSPCWLYRAARGKRLGNTFTAPTKLITKGLMLAAGQLRGVATAKTLHLHQIK